mmetsp:Transcript_616/g.1429  ORF Transcript_616/g.1429 Transcript_616/m.1429 type:complete len:105 (+) Transcript_616:80-394(+)
MSSLRLLVVSMLFFALVFSGTVQDMWDCFEKDCHAEFASCGADRQCQMQLYWCKKTLFIGQCNGNPSAQFNTTCFTQCCPLGDDKGLYGSLQTCLYKDCINANA